MSVTLLDARNSQDASVGFRIPHPPYRTGRAKILLSMLETFLSSKEGKSLSLIASLSGVKRSSIPGWYSPSIADSFGK